MTKRTREQQDDDNDQLPSNELLQIVKEINAYKGNYKMRKSVFSKKYPEFVKRYEHLFEMACEDGFDFERFLYMLNLRDKITTKATTLEAASVEVGQKMFDVYIKDNLPPVPTNVENASTS